VALGLVALATGCNCGYEIRPEDHDALAEIKASVAPVDRAVGEAESPAATIWRGLRDAKQTGLERSLAGTDPIQ
jgi:hypothetical protein